MRSHDFGRRMGGSGKERKGKEGEDEEEEEEEEEQEEEEEGEAMTSLGRIVKMRKGWSSDGDR